MAARLREGAVAITETDPAALAKAEAKAEAEAQAKQLMKEYLEGSTIHGLRHLLMHHYMYSFFYVISPIPRSRNLCTQPKFYLVLP